MVLPKLHGTTNTSDKTTLVAWCRQRPTRMWQGAANGRRRLACANAHNVQVYGWMRWKLSEHPTVPTTTRATALECVLSESNPNPRAAFCVSCLMHCCQRPTFSVQRLSKTNWLVSAIFDKVMSDAAACRNGRATQHGNSCWRMARSKSTRFATTAGPSLAFLKCHFSGPWH